MPKLSFIERNFIALSLVFIIVMCIWTFEIVDRKYLIGFFTCLLLVFMYCILFDNRNVIFVQLKCFIEIIPGKIKNNQAIPQKRESHLRLLVIGRSKSGKSLTVESCIQKTCGETDSGDPELKSARNPNSYGWDVYALVYRPCLESFCEEVTSLSSAEKVFELALNYRIHTLIYCFSYIDGFTEEDKQFIDMLKSVSKSSQLKRSLILVMTHGEVFQETKEQRGYSSFLKWLQEMEPCVLKNILDECENRCVMFQNKTDNRRIKKQQADELFIMAEKMIWKNGVISSDIEIVNDTNRELKEKFCKELMYLLRGKFEQFISEHCNNNKELDCKHLEFQPNEQINGFHVIPQMAGKSYFTRDISIKTVGDHQYRMIQAYFCQLKENIRAEEFTDTMHQEGILSIEEKQDIDQMPGINKKKNALFEAIHLYRNKGSVDVFLKILQEKYSWIYESWSNMFGKQYQSITAFNRTDEKTATLALE